MYAVARGRVQGIFSTWKECQDSVKGFSGALFKKFETVQEAQSFLRGSFDKSFDKETDHDNQIDNQIDYYVYTDGACRHNGTKHSRAAIGIFFGVGDPRNVSQPIQGNTNNIAELTAIVETYERIEPDLVAGKKIGIATDSEYAIKCVSTYGDSCAKKNWEVDIPNKGLVRHAYQLYHDSGVRFVHVKAHTKKGDLHSIGNAHADHLATSALRSGLEDLS